MWPNTIQKPSPVTTILETIFLGPRVEFVVGDPARDDRMRRRHQRIEPRFDGVLVEAVGRDIEIEPGLVFDDRAAGDGAGHDREQWKQTSTRFSVRPARPAPGGTTSLRSGFSYDVEAAQARAPR